MKVILTAEVKGKGHEGDVVDVAHGYAVNYLLPRKMAVQATPGNLKQLEARRSNIQQRNEARRQEAEGLAGAIDGKTVVIEAKAGEEGKLFGSVTTTMIEEALKGQLGQEVDHRRMDMGRSIKTVGDHVVVASIFGDVKAEVTVRVVPEGGALVAEHVPEDAAEAAAMALAAEETEVPAPESAEAGAEESTEEQTSADASSPDEDEAASAAMGDAAQDETGEPESEASDAPSEEHEL